MNRRAAIAAVLAVLALLVLLGVVFAPHAAGDAPVTPTTIPASEFVPLSVVLPSSPVRQTTSSTSQDSPATEAPRSAGPGAPGVNPALHTSSPVAGNRLASPSLRPVPRIAAVRTAAPKAGSAPVTGHPSAGPARSAEGSAIRGVATYYAYVPGGAAAGPALRAALGPDWRGMRVRVCAGFSCVAVVLSDWMRAEKLIDLDSRSFSQLAPLSAGIVRVTVSW